MNSDIIQLTQQALWFVLLLSSAAFLNIALLTAGSVYAYRVLVPEGRGGAHVMVSVDDLVTEPVLGDEEVIFVRQLAGRMTIRDSHAAPPCSKSS